MSGIHKSQLLENLHKPRSRNNSDAPLKTSPLLQFDRSRCFLVHTVVLHGRPVSGYLNSNLQLRPLITLISGQPELSHRSPDWISCLPKHRSWKREIRNPNRRQSRNFGSLGQPHSKPNFIRQSSTTVSTSL